MRTMAEMMHECIGRQMDFAMETTLAGRSYARLITEWRRKGYAVHIVFLRLPDAGAAVQRVAQRVSLGGHHVPDPIVRRRFAQGWANFLGFYRDLADHWTVYDSSGDLPMLLEKGSHP
jgi:predicted ABC-type ATPase